MQFNIVKRKMDVKVKSSLLLCCFISWGVFSLRNSISDNHAYMILSLVVIILLLLHPFVINIITTLKLKAWNPRITDYDYVEWGSNGLYFRYDDLDLRIDTNITEINIEKKGYDYLFGFGNNRNFLIPTEKPSEWKGNDKFSFMYLAKLLVKNHAYKIPVTCEGAWSLSNIKEKVLSGQVKYHLSTRESSLEFSKICLDKDFLVIESPDKNKGDIKVNTHQLSFIYEVQTPKTNYWLNILGFKDKFLVVKIDKNWLICKI